MVENIKFNQDFFDNRIRATDSAKRLVEYLELKPVTQSTKSALMNFFPDLSEEEVSRATQQNEEEEKLSSGLYDLLKPWLSLPSTSVPLPTFSAIEIARLTGLSESKILEIVRSGNITIRWDNDIFIAQTDLQKLPDSNTVKEAVREENKYGRTVNRERKRKIKIDYTLERGNVIGKQEGEEILRQEVALSPKRLIKRSLDTQYKQGSTSIARTRFSKRKFSNQIPLYAKEKARIRFERSPQEDLNGISNGNLSNQSLDVQQQLSNYVARSRNLEAVNVITQEPNADKLFNVYSWFREQGTKSSWILGDSELLFANNLIRFSKGEATDFLIWNCMGFYWTKAWRDKFPKVDVVANVDESIALYYINKLKEIAKNLSPIAPPTFTILLPTNEVFDNTYSSLGLYSQSTDERQEIIEQTQVGLQSEFKKSAPELSIGVLTWEEYLTKITAPRTQNEYTKLGNIKLTSSPNFRSIKNEMLQSAKARFTRKGINLDPKVLLAIQEAYYSMYVGEGTAFSEMTQRDRNILILNFEEMRVSQLEYLGADGNITILTPIKPNDMTEFYKWKNKQIENRYQQSKNERKI
ncbi:hypothetical protein IPM62_02765 [Candidatus Woesebacteria bacterium]|nr:MAG: hypothetical protein IPM62_02765 [Candidatus Woesebacteria bacterium]